tara:strand:- start:745 stop:939 length:195 start_codon:yes stop_codon:yes gene_type:complete
MSKKGIRKYKVEDNRWDGKPDLIITLHGGPYTKERILNKTGWLTRDCTITELKHYRDMKFEGEE